MLSALPRPAENVDAREPRGEQLPGATDHPQVSSLRPQLGRLALMAAPLPCPDEGPEDPEEAAASTVINSSSMVARRGSATPCRPLKPMTSPTSTVSTAFPLKLLMDGGSEWQSRSTARRRTRGERSRYLREISQVRDKTSFLLWPTNKYVEAFHFWLSITLTYTFLVSPFQVAFLPVTPPAVFVLNRVVDVCLICDMWLQVFLAYQIDETSSRSPGLWVTNLSKIRRRYLKGWFIIDLIGLLSGVSEVLEMFAPSGKGTQAVRFARMVRLVRVLGMARSNGSSKQRLKSWIAERSTFVMSELVRWVVQLMLTAHMVACVWGYLAVLQEELPDSQSWLTAVETSKNIHIPRDSPMEMYLVSLYWAFTTLLTIGYGDITATTKIEFAVVTIIMVVGATAWTIFMATACAVVTAMDADRLHHGMDMERLERMCTDQKFPVDLTRRLRNFLARSRRMQRRAEQQHLMSRMSPALQSEVTVHTTERFLRQVPFLEGVEEGFVSLVAEALQMHIFPPREWIVPGDLAAHVKSVVGANQPSYMTSESVEPSTVVATKGLLDPLHCPHLTMLESGIAVRRVILCRGSCWHDDFILHEGFFRDFQVAQSLVYCTVYTIDRKTFFAALKTAPYPVATAAIRDSALALAMTRLMTRAAELAPQHSFQIVESVNAVRCRVGTDEEQETTSLFSKLSTLEEKLEARQVAVEKKLEELLGLMSTVVSHDKAPKTC